MHEMYDKTKDAFIVSTLLLRNGDGLMAMRKMVRMWRKVHELTDDWHMNHHHFNHNRSLRRKQDQRFSNNFLRFQKDNRFWSAYKKLKFATEEINWILTKKSIIQ